MSSLWRPGKSNTLERPGKSKTSERPGKSKTLERPVKSKAIERRKAIDEEPEVVSKTRSRGKTVLNSLKGKLLWKRTRASTLPETYPVSSKSCTLPTSRQRLPDEDEDSSVVKFEIPMNGSTPTRAFHYSTEDLCAPDGQELIRKHSSDSSDSGVDTIAGSMPSCCVVETHNSDGITLRAQYDGKSVANAFGPMKDFGRFVVYQIEHNIGSRPPCPLPPAIQPVIDENSVRDSGEKDDAIRVGDEKVYDTVSPNSQSQRGLSLGLRDLAQHGWYWGPITRQEAEEILCGQTDGTFLVRDSSNDRYLLSVSFRSQGRTLHTRIEYGNGNFSFFGFPEAESDSFGSVVELINCSVRRSQNNSVFCFSRARTYHSVAIPVRLSIPMSRFMSVQSLQHRCRFVIRQHTRFDLIRELPLPKLLHNYLQQSQY